MLAVGGLSMIRSPGSLLLPRLCARTAAVEYIYICSRSAGEHGLSSWALPKSLIKFSKINTANLQGSCIGILAWWRWMSSGHSGHIRKVRQAQMNSVRCHVANQHSNKICKCRMVRCQARQLSSQVERLAERCNILASGRGILLSGAP